LKVNRKQKAKNREKILLSAAKKFRERGFNGISVNELMKSAGFTHGGFYGHFASKEDLMVKVCNYSIDKSMMWLYDKIKIYPDFTLAALAKSYLTHAIRDDPGNGCLLTTLPVDVTRQSPKIKKVFTEGLQKFVAFTIEATPGKSNSTKRKKNLATWSMLVGAMILARAVNDPKFSDEILNAASESI
jgi:TetR/AcrR family transcriptional repressor of nem operon